MLISRLRSCALLLITLAWTADISPVHAQSSVSGRVLDQDEAPVGFANVQLLHAADSSLARATIAEEDGTFELSGVAPGPYLLFVSLIGYADSMSNLEVMAAEDRYPVGPVTLTQETIEMEEVAVESRRILYEQRADRLVVNVANSATLAGRSAVDILKRSPGVVVNEQSNTISLVGKDGVQILVNGKRTYVPSSGLVQYLASISADNVESIELITSPPASMDAEGNAGFINIVMKQRVEIGLNGNVSATGGYGKGEMGNAAASITYQLARLAVFGSYSFLLNGREQRGTNYRRIENGDRPMETPTSTVRDPFRTNHDARLAMDYEVTDRTTVGGLVGAYDHKWTMDAVNTMLLRSDGTDMMRIVSENDEINHWRHAMGNLYVHHERKDASIRADLDYVYYHDNNPTNYNNTRRDLTSGETENELLSSGKKTPIRIVVGKVDYQSDAVDGLRLESGVKGAFSRFVNDASYEGLVDEAWISAAGLVSKSTLREDVLAAYGSVDLQLDDSTSIKTGLRYEYTRSHLEDGDERPLLDRRFGSLFPSVVLTKKLSGRRQVDASYTRRITRPSFSDIAPFLYFIDPFTFFTGNTALQPAMINTLKLDLTYKDLLASVQYAWEDSSISRFQNRVLPDENVQLIFANNMKHTQRASLMIALPFDLTRWWNAQNNATAYWQQIDGYIDGRLTPSSQTTVALNSIHNLTLPADFDLEIAASYQTASQWGLLDMDPVWGVDLAVRRNVGRDGTVTVALNDVFDSQVWGFRSGSPGDPLYTQAKWDLWQRTLQLTYSHRFGDGRSSRSRTTASAEERTRVE